ncbi:copper-binding protein [Massilia sp. UMI-21]|nr:copper-binding protein [Massilia sp. UMI-21]
MNAFPMLALAIAMATCGTVAFAQDSHGAHAAPAPVELTEGEVKKIDTDAGKITMKHGPIKNLDMNGMTMVLRVKDAAMLEQVKVGDKVRFAADRVNGAITVVQLEKQQ